MPIEAIDLTLSDDDEEISIAHSESLLKSWGARPQPAKVKPVGSQSVIPLDSAAVAAGSTPVPRTGQVPQPINGYHSVIPSPRNLDIKNITLSTAPLRQLAPPPTLKSGHLPLDRPSGSQHSAKTAGISSATQLVSKQPTHRPLSGTTNGSHSTSTSKVAPMHSTNTPALLPPSRKMAIAASQPYPNAFGNAWNSADPTLASGVARLPGSTPNVAPDARVIEPDSRMVATSGVFNTAIGAQKSGNSAKMMVTPQSQVPRTSSSLPMSTAPQSQSNLQSPLYGSPVPVQWPGSMASAQVGGFANAATHLKATPSQVSASLTGTQGVVPGVSSRSQSSEAPRPQQPSRDATPAETRHILDPYFHCPVAQEMLASNPMPAASLLRMRKIFVMHPATRTDIGAFLAKLGISKPGKAQPQEQPQTQTQAAPNPPPKVQAQAHNTSTPLPHPQGRVDQAAKFTLYTPPQPPQGSVAQENSSVPHTSPRQALRISQQAQTSTPAMVTPTPSGSQVPAQTFQLQPEASQAGRPPLKGVKRTADGTVKLPEIASIPSYDSTYYSKEAMSAASRLAEHGADPTTRSRATATSSTVDTFAAKDLNSRDPIKDERVRYLKRLIVSQKSGNPARDAWKSTPQEDELVDLLKQYVGLTWAELGKYFPYRNSWHTLQHRYSDRTIASRVQASEGSTSVSVKPPQTSIPSYEKDSVPRSAASRHTKLLAPTKTMSTDDESDAGVPRPRSKRAAVEAASKKGYAITRESFYGHTSDSEHSEIVPDTSRISARNHYVTCLEHETLIERARFEDEHARDSAAIAASLEKISRSPLVNIQAHTKRKTLRKRQSIEIIRPYLTKSERDYVGASNLTECNTAWCGKALHVHFTDIEVEILEPCMTQVMLPQTTDSTIQRDRSLRQWVAEVMSTANGTDITEIYQRYMNSGMNLPGRSRISIESYLEDLTAQHTTHQPLAKRIGHVKPSHFNAPRVSSSLRQRELGSTSLLAKAALLTTTLGPSRVFKKASSDVTNVAWAPNGEAFAIGSAALMDNHSMQYNRRNNLLLGDVTVGNIQELPHHAIKRVAVSGVNTTQDQLLYTSVSAVKFGPNGTTMFTAGYDNVARIWAIEDGIPYLGPQYRHKSTLELLEVNASGNLFATASRQAERSIQVLRTAIDTPEDRQAVNVFSSPKATKYPDWQIMPSVLRWGPAAMGQEKYLVAGFSSTLRDSGGQGQTCIWDIEAQVSLPTETGSGSVFDIAWSPTIFGRLAIASSPSGSVNKGTHSVVRIMDSYRLNHNSKLYVKPQHVFELECPAIDVNDVIFNSKDNNLITTGCTDGRVYLWDLRRPDDIMHCFSHGKTLVELDLTSGQSAESLDTGIRFVSWDESGRKLFSGSSDGVVALWDPYVAPEDAHVRNIVQLGSGVMSGAFSPDFSNLLLGEEDGTVTMLSVGNEVDSRQPLKYKDIEKFTYNEAEQENFDNLYDFLEIETVPDDDTKATAGIRAARAKLDTKEMKWAPLSGFPRGQAVQGPYYRGPYNHDPDADLLKHENRRFQYQRRQRPEYECRLQHEISYITEEERGDDGTSKSRIPAQVRMHTGAQVICFRCNTAVLKLMSPLPDDDILGCHDCCMAWRVDVLGYTQVDYYTDETLPQIDFRDLENMTARLTLGQIVEDDHAAQDVEGWAHGLWGTGDEDE